LCIDVCPTDAIKGIKAELHSIDQFRCIKCKACYEVCRFDPLAGNAITISSKRNVA
jgi:Fe-S-cluster-containing hydrogenase component 2